jgi:hypothetical protein
MRIFEFGFVFPRRGRMIRPGFDFALDLPVYDLAPRFYV